MGYYPGVESGERDKGGPDADSLREALRHPPEGWRELQASFAPVDVETGERMRRVPPDFDGARRAAVLVPVVMVAGGPEVVYTLRRSHLSDHAGQISFPGGSREDSDDSLLETALREAREEIDLLPDLVEVIGELEDMYIPPSNFLVKPFVGVLPPEAEFTIAPDEVEEILVVPLSRLLEPSTLQHAILERDGRRYKVPVFAIGNREDGEPEYRIWGATAAITADLLTRLGWSPNHTAWSRNHLSRSSLP